MNTTKNFDYKPILDHDQYEEAIENMLLITSNINLLFCNMFMKETVRLIKSGLELFEIGYYDAGFYSLRQAIENMNNMLYFTVDKDKMKDWKDKRHFPRNKDVMKALEKMHEDYLETKEKMPDFFLEYDKLLRKVNKYIHKQGLDTFYSILENKKNYTEQEELFTNFLKYTISLSYLINIIINPIILIVSDDELRKHMHIKPIEEPLPQTIINSFLSDIINKIKETTYYKSYKDYFFQQEKMSDAVFWIKDELPYFDITKLDEIEKQKHLLDLDERLIFELLKNDIKFSAVINNFGILYVTSIKANETIPYEINACNSDRNSFYVNQKYKSMYKSQIIHTYTSSYDYTLKFAIFHNDKFNSIETTKIQDIYKNIFQIMNEGYH